VAGNFGSFDVLLVLRIAKCAALVVHSFRLESRQQIKEVILLLYWWDLGRSLRCEVKYINNQILLKTEYSK
jgi:hypothetical protein